MIDASLVELAVAWLIIGYFVSLFFRGVMRELFGYEAVGAGLFMVSICAWIITGLIGVIGLWFIDLDNYT